MRSKLVVGGALLVGACVGSDPGTSPGTSPPVADAGGGTGDSGSTPPVGDGGSSGTPPDAGGDGGVQPPCNLDKPFGEVATVAGLESIGSVARFSADQKTAYYATTNATGHDQLVRAAWDDVLKKFEKPVVLPALSDDNMGETTPSISDNGLMLFYTHGTGTDRDIYFASRQTLSGEFGNVNVLKDMNAESYQDDYVTVDSRGDLWFSTQRSDTRLNIAHSSNTGGGWGVPDLQVDLNAGTAPNYYVALSGDRLRIYFSRGAVGALDVFTTKRANTTAQFEVPTEVTELHSAQDDRVAWLSSDGCTMYISRGENHTMYVTKKPAF